MSSSVTARRNARRTKRRRIALGVGLRIAGNDLDAVAEVTGGRRPLAQVAEDGALAGGRPGFVQRSFHFHPLNRQARSLPLVGTLHMDGIGPGQTIREDVDVLAQVDPLDKFKDGRLVGGRVEVADQAALAGHLRSPRGRPDPKGDRFAAALKSRSGNSERGNSPAGLRTAGRTR